MGTITVLRHELTAQWRDGRARAVMLIALLLLAVSASVGAQQHARQAAERHLAYVAEWQRWLNQPPRNPHSAAHYGLYVFKPASPLALLDPGLDPYLGISTWLEAHWMNELIHRPAQDATALARFPRLDPAQTLQRIVPLVLILLGFGAMAGERARGTLQQLVSLGLSPVRLGTGKLLGTASWLLLVLVPASIIAAIAIARMPQGEGTLLRLFLWALVHVAYLGGWALLVLAVSTRARTPRAALASLLGIWLMVCWILPRASAELAATAHPLPSSAERREQLEQALAEAHPSEQALRIRDRVLAEHGVERTEDLPIDWRGISLQEGEEANYPVFDRHFESLFDGYRAQDRVLQYLGFAAPLLAVQMLSQSTAGSDLTHHRHFVFAAEQHRRVIQKLMNENVTLYDREGTDYRADPALWATVPPFDYHPPALGPVLAEQRPAAAALLFWVFATAAFAYLQLRRVRL